MKDLWRVSLAALLCCALGCGDGGKDSDDEPEICDNLRDDDGDGLVDCDDALDCAAYCEPCAPGLYGEDCVWECSGGADTPCSDHGACDDGRDGTGACTCDTGYFGADCGAECPGGAATVCGGNGTCDDGSVGTGACTCDAGYFGADCVAECPGGAATACGGNGTCDDGSVGTGACTCDAGYFGADCVAECPGGAATACNGNGTCDDGALGAGTCTCDGAFVGPDCAYEPGPVTVQMTCGASFFWAGFIVFHDATGAVLDVSYSDALEVSTFTATYDTMPPGGMITAGMACDEGVGTDFYYRMHTLTEILPDRTYALKAPYNSNSFIIPTNVGDLYYDPQLPSEISADVTHIITDAGCEPPQERAVGASPLFHNVTLACLNRLSTFDLVLRAVDADDNVLATATSVSHPYTSDGNTPDVATISSWTVGADAFRTSFTSAPEAVTVSGVLRAVRNTYDYRSIFSIAAPVAIAALGAVDFDWDIALGFADAYRYDFTFAFDGRPGEVTLASRRLAPDATYDLSAGFQPEVTITDLTYDRPAQQWSVTLDAAGVHTNTFLATFRWWNPDFEEGGTWHVYLPELGDVVTPALPTDVQLPILSWWLPPDDPSIEYSFWYEIWDVLAPVSFTDLVDIWGTVGYPALLGDLEAITDEYDVWVTHYPQRYRQLGL